MINPSQFDLHSLRVFLQVALTGSLTRAAEKSHMTLSALSKRIAELERTADCSLFTRHPRGLELTPAGTELVHHARAVLDAVNRMAFAMGDFAIAGGGQAARAPVPGVNFAGLRFADTEKPPAQSAIPFVGLLRHHRPTFSERAE